jgi:hypothetical protein
LRFLAPFVGAGGETEQAAADILGTEQQRWADFNQRLEGIERALSDGFAVR